MATLKERVNFIKISAECDFNPKTLDRHVTKFELPAACLDNSDLLRQKLRSMYGWHQPVMVFGYSEKGLYKDLYVYFDYFSNGIVNQVATKIFKMYGLEGSQHEMNWDSIQGDCIMMRADPPRWSDTPLDAPPDQYDNTLTRREIIKTIKFFKTRNAYKIARQRDAARFMSTLSPEEVKSVGKGKMVYTDMSTSFVPVDDKKAEQLAAYRCSRCAKPGTMKRDLKQCPCKNALYCDTKCQKSDWKEHKLVCSTRKPQTVASNK